MHYLRKLSLLLLLASFLTPTISTAQELAPCGTDLGISPWLRDFQTRIHSAPRTDEILYLPLQVHVLGTDNGSGYFSKKAVFRAFCTLNEDFAQADIQFFLAGPINYINNSNYYDHEYGAGFNMMNQNNIPNAINCYIVESPAGNCGYFAPGPDGIALSKGCLGVNDHTWAHEVGHFLSLPHPFYGWEGESHDYDMPAPNSWDGWQVERLDGSNCNFSGDGFCDTAPDYLNYRWNCNAEGTSNTVQTDPNGETFVSDGTLYMSYSNSSCKSTFSDDQIAAMRANVQEQRPNLVTVPAVDFSIAPLEDITVISPQAGSLAEGNPITLEWEPVPGATQYLVQINPFNFFSIVFDEQLVTSPSVQLSGLQSDRTYYWRILPFNEYNTCSDFSSPSSFETGITTSTNALLATESLAVFPNPSKHGWVNLRLQTSVNTQAHWQLSNSQGQLQQSGSFNTSNGQQEERIDVQQLPAGIYFVRLQLEDRQTVRKLVIY